MYCIALAKYSTLCKQFLRSSQITFDPAVFEIKTGYFDHKSVNSVAECKTFLRFTTLVVVVNELRYLENVFRFFCYLRYFGSRENQAVTKKSFAAKYICMILRNIPCLRLGGAKLKARVASVSFNYFFKSPHQTLRVKRLKF